MTIPPAPLPANIKYINSCINIARENNANGADGLIIIFPEFILQPKEGAYTNVQRGYIETYLTNILAGLPNNIMVCFGTIVSENAGNFYNEMPYGIGKGKLKFTDKLLMSHIDLIDIPTFKQAIGWHTKNTANIIENRLCQNTSLQPNNIGQWSAIASPTHTIDFKGKRFGFSICLDYAEKILLKRLGVGNEVDVHLVSSCGMSYFNGEHNMTKENGSVITCDARGEQSSVHKMKAGGTSVHRSSMKTTKYNIDGVDTKIRRTQFFVDN
ncbi:hypothetical protein NMX13_03180 [Dickeya zeae]|nr:hypothetical protein NMX13_03180 [Dickeya zeae]